MGSRTLILCTAAVILSACTTGNLSQGHTVPVNDEVLGIAEAVLAAAATRDAEAFAAHFADRDDFVYTINSDVIRSRRELTETFSGMLARQAEFRPVWIDRHVQQLTERVAVFTGHFQTTARRINGEAWEARGLVTFVAERTAGDWKIVNWHTSE